MSELTEQEIERKVKHLAELAYEYTGMLVAGVESDDLLALIAALRAAQDALRRDPAPSARRCWP